MLALLGAPLAAQLAARALAQQSPYATLPAVPHAGSAAAARSLGAPLPRVFDGEALARRSHVVARAADAVVTVGDIEDRIAGATLTDLEAWRAPGGRERLVHEELRRVVLAREAEALGLGSRPEVIRAEREALAARLVAVEFHPSRFAPTAEEIAAATPPSTPELRHALVAFAPDAAAARALASRLSEAPVDDRAALVAALPEVAGAPHAAGPSGEHALVAADGEAPLDPALRAALFALEGTNAVSEPVRVGRLYAVVVCSAVYAAREVPRDDDATAARLAWERRDRALEELVARLREQDVRELHADRLNPAVLDFRSIAEAERPPEAPLPEGAVELPAIVEEPGGAP